jgi:hypothetical protein
LTHWYTATVPRRRPSRPWKRTGDRIDWNAIGLALLVIAGLGLVGLPLTIRNYRSVYR